MPNFKNEKRNFLNGSTLYGPLKKYGKPLKMYGKPLKKVDAKKADLDKDGKLSDYESNRANAAFGSALPKKKGLWANIHAKKKRGETMRKKGDKGAPTEQAIRDSQ